MYHFESVKILDCFVSCRVANVGKQKLLYITQHRLDLESSFFLDSNGKSEPVNVF